MIGNGPQRHPEEFERLRCACGSDVFDKIPCAYFERDRLAPAELTMRPTIRFRCAKCTKPLDARFPGKGQVTHE